MISSARKTGMMRLVSCLVILACFVCFFVFAPSKRVRSAAYYRLSLGMKKREVEAILVHPESDVDYSKIWPDRRIVDERIDEEKIKGTVLSFSSWEADNGVIYLVFDEKEELVGMVYEEFIPNQHLSDRIRKWIIRTRSSLFSLL